MMSKALTRVLSLVLILAMLVPYVPVYAEDADVEATIEATEIVEEVSATELATEPAAEPEAEPATEPAAEPETEPAAEPETQPATEPAAEPETEPAAEETEPATEPEETEPEETELPFGFPGMPEGYELSEEELAAKAELAADGTAELLAGLTAGVDYVEGCLIFTCEDEAYAAMVAAAYDALLVEFSYGIATIQLQNATVLEAVTAAADMEVPLPAVSPNYITKVEPMITTGDLSSITSFFALPERQSWETWVFENLANPDPAIADPQYLPFQWHHDAINTYEAWGVTTGRSDIVVAVIDSGVATHADIANLSHINVGPGTGDTVGHGTHVAGIIAATLGNGQGGAGVAPGVSILSIKTDTKDAYGDIQIQDEHLAKAIRAATNAGAHIINMSIGGAFPSTTIRNAVNYAVSNGVTVVASMGNDGSNAINYPAAYDGVIGVVATDAAGQRSFYSNYGAWADVCAPGTAIYSTYPGGSYTYMDGTSMASPVVAGVCALYMSVVGWVSPATMESVLEKSCNKISGSGLGAGIVDAAKMLDKVVDAPELLVWNENKTSFYLSSNNATVSCDEYITFGSDFDVYTNNVLIYTINGKTPSVKDGQVVNGIEHDWNYIPLEQYKGTTITVRAATVNGMGNISKVVTWKLKVEESDKVESVSIVAPDRLVAGKSVKLSAVVQPADKADQNVIWSISKRTGDTANVKISSNGTLTTPAKKSGTVTVKAVSAVDGSVSDTHVIRIDVIEPVGTIKLDKSTANIFTGNQLKISVATLLDAKKNPVFESDCGLQWTSSNEKVATVDENGWVTGLSKGKATITCKALDGSNKSAKCTVNVMQPVEYIEITGQDTIAPGANATMKAVVYPTTANNKKVTWSLLGAPAGVSISASGAVKVDKSVSTGKSFDVYAQAADGSGIWCIKHVTVAPKCTAVNIDYAGTYGTGRFTYNSKGYVTAANLFNTDLYADATYARSEAQLVAYTPGNGYASVEWSSSNKKVATVDQNGLVKAVGKGTATITCKALDGSNKKATVKVTVSVPVSQMTIKTNAPQMTDFYPCVAFGKTVKNTVVFGDTYGKPTNTKVDWSYNVYLANGDGEIVTEYTTYCANNKLVTLSNGNLKVNAKMRQKLWEQIDWGYDIVIKVTATAKDGSGVSAEQYFYAIPGATKIKCIDGNKLYGTVDHTGPYGVLIYCDQINYSSSDYTRFFTATSSNPKVASVYDVQPVFDRYGNREYGYYYVVVAALSAGQAKITVKTADGTNLSCSFTVVLTD